MPLSGTIPQDATLEEVTGNDKNFEKAKNKILRLEALIELLPS